MRYFAVIGNPINHSKSPLMHNSAFSGLRLDGHYGRYLLEDGDDFRKRVLGLKLSGCNITLPFKEYAFRACDEIDSLALKIGAINTIVLENGQLKGFNTDGEGFCESIQNLRDLDTFLILGAGGSAKSIAFSLQARGKRVLVANRSEERLLFFKDAGFDVSTFENLKYESFDVVVNSTSAGLNDEALPLKREVILPLFSGAKLVYDCIYGKETSFLKLADEIGVDRKDGKEMLVNQGVLAFEIFTNIKDRRESIKKYMLRAFDF